MDKHKMWTPLIIGLLYIAGTCRGNLPHYKLMKDLFKDYNPYIRPVKNNSATTVVNIGLHVSQIIKLDEKNQVLTGKYWVLMTWDDEYLTWNKSDYENVHTINIPVDKIWFPDIVLFNSIQENMFTCDIEKNLARVFSDGSVIWTPSCVFETACQVDVSSYPFDKQQCQLQMGPWSYGVEMVDIAYHPFHVPPGYYNPSGEWLLENITYKHRLDAFENDVSFALGIISVELRRKPMYYVVNLVGPCFMLAAIGSLTFCLPPDSGEKISLSITILLAITVFQMVVADALPSTSDHMPILSIFTQMCMLLLTAAIVMSVVTTRLCSQSPFQEERAPPRCISIVFNKWMRRVLLGSGGKRSNKRKRQNNEFENQHGTNVDEFIPVKALHKEENDGTQQNETMNEWIIFTAVLDRLCFVIYWTILIFGAIVFSVY